ncbi:MAG TPA: phosphopyruvate hydratase [Casimicrobiaceae bacterium]|nr:phosphopyruvate hydratase [Casimicrobiaceae bacterium]
MFTRIKNVRALEILDSRGVPTVRVEVALAGGVRASSSVPSGLSTGRNEALELRDGGSHRYWGNGVTRAVLAINDAIGPALANMDAARQTEIDGTMIQLDGTPNKAKLGANAILGVSQACARAAAMALRVPLYEHLGGVGAIRIPMPMINVINGGKHADSNLDFQEFMIVPVGAPSFREALRRSAETFQALKAILERSGQPTSVGDEGGFAPRLESNEDACRLIVQAIGEAGYQAGADIAIALDPAATSFHENGTYRLSRSGQGEKTSAQMTELYCDWVRKYPIVSIEDGLAEDDWEGFRTHTAALGDKVQIVGDDLLCTNTRFIGRAIREHCCNAALIKLNQIGTVSETIESVDLCRRSGWGYVISHRSGETEDAFMADFSVAMGGGQIKAGSVCRGERIAKYNRLLEIEQELGAAACFARWGERAAR